ncbi:UNKNOWN [Stylonychia lemnae]|uniref:Amino acid transporter transmembrane domain-containing protein n=1 Tax=Stylonychia lemnae TaxID=5949 RepID=A0A078AAX5_STYLE|nr:UNKNOWN [Stylonychia lemnae]|eukprot:CDW79405.1 UNKNOWN [Stylonychia lemnae]
MMSANRQSRGKLQTIVEFTPNKIHFVKRDNLNICDDNISNVLTSNKENNSAFKQTPNRQKLADQYYSKRLSNVTLEGRMSRLRHSEKYIVKLNESESFTSTFKALVGIGILSCPSAYKQVGLFGGILGSIIVIILVNILYNQMNFPKFLSLISLSMEGTALLPGIYASTQNKKAYRKILISAVSLDGILTMILSSIGYLSYGQGTRDIVIMNLRYGIVSNLVQFMYAFGVLCSFILQLFPILEVIENFEWYTKFVKQQVEEYFLICQCLSYHPYFIQNSLNRKFQHI